MIVTYEFLTDPLLLLGKEIVGDPKSFQDFTFVGTKVVSNTYEIKERIAFRGHTAKNCSKDFFVLLSPGPKGVSTTI